MFGKLPFFSSTSSLALFPKGLCWRLSNMLISLQKVGLYSGSIRLGPRSRDSSFAGLLICLYVRLHGPRFPKDNAKPRSCRSVQGDEAASTERMETEAAKARESKVALSIFLFQGATSADTPPAAYCSVKSPM